MAVMAFGILSCNDDEDNETPLLVPDTYEFERNGQSSVFYGGQTDRLNQLSEMKTYLQKGDMGEAISAQVLNDMYANTDGNGGGNFTFTSTGKQLKDKTFGPDVSFYEALFAKVEEVSAAPGTAANGTAGLIARSNGNNILVDENGHEFTQVVEKGIMGSVFLNQIYNAYLTDEKIGEEIENTALDATNNYTKMEHHWDEAFGYYGVPVDFPVTKTNRFWGNYSNGRDALLQTNSILMDAFKTGRAAIVTKRYEVKDQQREIIYEGFELIAASTAIHYLNDAKEFYAADESGDALHAMSEGYMFIKALRLSPKKRITDAQLTEIFDTHIGENFWAIKDTDLSGLDAAITTLVAAYPELGPVKGSL